MTKFHAGTPGSELVTEVVSNTLTFASNPFFFRSRQNGRSLLARHATKASRCAAPTERMRHTNTAGPSSGTGTVCEQAAIAKHAKRAGRVISGCYTNQDWNTIPQIPASISNFFTHIALSPPRL